MKLLFAILLLLSITGCGVNSSSGASSAPAANNGDNNDSINGGDDNTTVPDDSDDNVTIPDDSDDNVTVPDDSDDNVTIPDDDNTTIDSIFDTTGDVVFDTNACNANLYRTAADASYNGSTTSENGSNFFNVEGEGLQIRSEHLEGSPANASKTFVTLFYKIFPTTNDLGLQGSTSYVLEGFFFLIYDNAWVDESIPNVNNTVYVLSAQTEKPSCYRLVLNSVTDQEADLQKVYR